MEQQLNIEVTCTHCGKVFPSQLYTYVDAETQSIMAQAIHRGSFFTRTCPYCNGDNDILHKLTYVDMPHHAAIVYDEENPGEQVVIEIADVYRHLLEQHQARGDDAEFRFRVVTDPNVFIEKANLFYMGYDDRVWELMKVFLATSLNEQNPHLEYEEIAFVPNHTDGTAQVHFYHDGNVCAKTRFEEKVYQMVEKDFSGQIHTQHPQEQFAVDTAWALSLMGTSEN